MGAVLGPVKSITRHEHYTQFWTGAVLERCRPGLEQCWARPALTQTLLVK